MGKGVVIFTVLWSGAHGVPEQGKKVSISLVFAESRIPKPRLRCFGREETEGRVVSQVLE